ncbi:MAG: energy transducer TonB [Kiritimatiellales bacterium]|nr:energy transducer TonB [Kiritimatiellales bacterium]
MRKRHSIINAPLLIGIVLSIALHVAALYSKGIYTPPKPKMDQGKTVVHLTLMPSAASQAAAPESDVEQAFQPALPAEPVAAPEPEPQPQPEPPQTPSPTPQTSSPEQDATLTEDKGVTAEAQTLSSVRPTYPKISRRRGEEGTVVLSIEVLATGKAGQISIIQSRGYARLDDAALKAAQQTTFIPATQFGRNIATATELTFTFRLTDE